MYMKTHITPVVRREVNHRRNRRVTPTQLHAEGRRHRLRCRARGLGAILALPLVLTLSAIVGAVMALRSGLMLAFRERSDTLSDLI